MDNTLLIHRLILKPVLLQDLLAVHELHSLPETDRFNTLGIPESTDHTKAIIESWIMAAKAEPSPAFTYTIRLKDCNTFIGLIALKCGNPKFRTAEVWYKLHVDHWRKGYATEALTRIIDFAFHQLQLHRIEAGCAIANTGSIRVLEKVGMTLEGRKRKGLPLKSGWSDNFEFAILAEDWAGNKPGPAKANKLA